MGALPSRETQRRGLYSHRHGRNRRNEVVLVPLTAEFFPDAHCPLFERLFQARHHRTAKYYYRSVRPASSDWESDYYCQTTAHAYNLDLKDPEGVNKDGLFETSFADSIEGLYHRLVRETEYCLCETDEELRQKYMEQLKQQREAYQHGNNEPTSSSSSSSNYYFPGGVSEGNFGVGSNAYVSGYRDAMEYMKWKEQHTHRNAGGTHVTSPAAFYLRPVPCAILSRFDPNKPTSEEGVEFLGSTVKVLGMFGLFPATIPVTVNGETVEQHMLKATMFVDKDVGDQILGNVVMLAVHMYVRQCMEARIRAPDIPMLPIMLRAPISNIPMLQFVREMRVRLQTLLDAGLPRKKARSMYSGLNGGSGNSLSACDSTDASDPTIGSQDTDGFLFEEDIPNGISEKELFMEPSEFKWLKSYPNQNTNPDGVLPILMMSGVNVQATPLKHPLLSSLAHVRIPAWATDSSAAAAAVNNNNNNNNTNNTNNTNTNTTTASAESFPFGQPNKSQSFSKTAALLARRRSRFRIWVEDGRLCIWASAAYARRGCLILAQQLTLTVDSNVLPIPRAWNYRGLLRSGLLTVPPPKRLNDVFIIERDMPSLGLYQGDVLRCSTTREIADHQQRTLATGLIPSTTTTTTSITITGTIGGGSSLDTPPVERPFSHIKTNPYSVTSTTESTESPLQPNSPANYSSNHVSNLLLQDPGEAPSDAFWVHVPYERDGMNSQPPERRRRSSGNESQQQQSQQSQQFQQFQQIQSQQQQYIDSVSYRPTNVEEVLLSWIKGISIQTRDAAENDIHWVREPFTGAPVRVDRYVIRRVEHDGVRYFIGVTPRFVGQQRRLERVLDEVKALHPQPHTQSDAEEGEENHNNNNHIHNNNNNNNNNNKHHEQEQEHHHHHQHQQQHCGEYDISLCVPCSILQLDDEECI